LRQPAKRVQQIVLPVPLAARALAVSACTRMTNRRRHAPRTGRAPTPRRYSRPRR
jgi:hypothetical protein